MKLFEKVKKMQVSYLSLFLDKKKKKKGVGERITYILFVCKVVVFIKERIVIKEKVSSMGVCHR